MAEEFEVTLLVACDDPDVVFKEIMDAGRFGEYGISPARHIIIQDRYFDTPHGTLGRSRCALRLRYDGEQKILCLKGREAFSAWGGVRRLEIEGPWSEEILREIAGQGGPVSCLREACYQSDPLTSLQDCGLQIIQSRRTSRILLHVSLSGDPSGTVLAELALDRVSYETRGEAFHHYELEIEAVSGYAPLHLERLIQILKGRYPDVLIPWNHNKLITGFAIEAVAKTRIVLPEAGRNTRVPLSWYEAMDEWIRNGTGCKV
ncbi:CYTH domain-containing protein [archaeon]|nr:CYTH domain-containing protein [archaeon]